LEYDEYEQMYEVTVKVSAPDISLTGPHSIAADNATIALTYVVLIDPLSPLASQIVRIENVRESLMERLDSLREMASTMQNLTNMVECEPEPFRTQLEQEVLRSAIRQAQTKKS
jgi:hypothetical protein